MSVDDELSAVALGLRMAVVEVEGHVSESGWDQPSRLFALAPTAELVAAEPELAADLGLSTADPDLFTPVEQELEDQSSPLEDQLADIMWPDSVAGALAVVERVVLPPAAEGSVPDDPTEAGQFVSEHESREDVRIAVGVLRSGQAHCVVRLRSHDSDDELLHGPDVVPALIDALRETLVP